MLAGKKHDKHAPLPAEKPGAPALSDVSASDGAQGAGAHVSPARALQNRLVKELSASSRPWMWHSAGLILVALLSLFAAGTMLNSGI